jgi:shikimate kinase
MWNSVQEFYSSKEWQIARMEAISNATNERGEVIDQYTGKPITNVRQIQVHHKIELTPANVNDYDISLNQDNLMVVSFASHNEIHNRFGYKQKKVYLVIGSVCSGKSTFVKEAAGHNDIILDMDSIWEAISNNERYHKPNSIKNIAFAVRETIIEQIAMRNFDSNAYVLSTEARAMPRKRLIERIGADEIIFMEATKEECYKRLYSDPQREPYIKEHSEFIEKFFNQLSFNENEHNYILK